MPVLAVSARDIHQDVSLLSPVYHHHEQTQPLIDYYTNAGILKTVDGTVDIDVVFQNIVEILGA